MNLCEWLCHHGPDKSDRQKMTSSTKITNFSSFSKRMEGWDTIFQLMWPPWPQPNFEECFGNISGHLHNNIFFYEYIFTVILVSLVFNLISFMLSCLYKTYRHKYDQYLYVDKNDVFEVPQYEKYIYMNQNHI